ncbi:MAG: copper transporter [Actinomycetota bacterium]
MIDFRYHLVSIVAVFLALAIGIVLGTAALNGPLIRGLQRTEETLKNTAANLRTTNDAQKNRITGDEKFAAAAAPQLLAGLLNGQQVVVITAPGADQGTVSGVSAAVRQAGGTVTGPVTLAQQFFDTSATTESSLSALAQQLAPAGIVVTAGTGQQADAPQLQGQAEAATVLAAALVAKPGGTVTETQTGQILAGFAQQGYLQAGSTAIGPASLAVVVSPATPPPAGDGDPANITLISLTQKLDLAGRGAVLAGSYPAGSGAGSAIDELTSGDTGIQVSSVDNADAETGQVITVQALAELLEGHKPAQYGVGAVPSPMPTAVPAASPTPTASATKHKARKTHKAHQ